MARTNSIPNEYTLAVNPKVHVKPLSGTAALPSIRIVFPGKVSAKAKKQMREAIAEGMVEIIESQVV